jgi:hypothetical protein
MRPGDPRDMLEVAPEPLWPPIGPGYERWRGGDRRRQDPVGYLIAAIILAIAVGIGFAAGRASAAAPPSAAHAIPAVSSAGASGNLEPLSGAPSKDSGTSPSPTTGMRPASAKAPLPALVRSGIATWYRDTGLDGDALYAAMPEYRFGQTPYLVAVCSFDDGRSRCLTVPVLDACQCYVGTADERLIDLSPEAFRWFAPLSLGKIRVEVRELR